MWKSNSFLVVSLIVLMLFFAPSSTRASLKYQVHSYQYGQLPDEVLDICAPESGGPYPGVVLIFGGGWAVGDKRGMLNSCKEYAAGGFVAASISHRLTRGANASSWPAQIEDAQLAVRWLKANSLRLNLDKRRLGALGYSSGGQLALLLGYLRAPYPGDMAEKISGESPQVSWVIAVSSPTNLCDFLPTDAAFRHVNALLGRTGVDQDDGSDRHELCKKASPIFYVSGKSVKTMIVHGKKDFLVPYSQAVELKKSLDKQGVKCELVEFNGGHNFYGLSAAQIKRIYQRIFDFAIRNTIL